MNSKGIFNIGFIKGGNPICMRSSAPDQVVRHCQNKLWHHSTQKKQANDSLLFLE